MDSGGKNCSWNSATGWSLVYEWNAKDVTKEPKQSQNPTGRCQLRASVFLNPKLTLTCLLKTNVRFISKSKLCLWLQLVQNVWYIESEQLKWFDYCNWSNTLDQSDCVWSITFKQRSAKEKHTVEKTVRSYIIELSVFSISICEHTNITSLSQYLCHWQ